MTDPLPDYYRAAVVPEQLRAGLCALCRTPTGGSEFCSKCSNAPYRPDAAGFTTSHGNNAIIHADTITDALGNTRRQHYDNLAQLIGFT